MSTDLADRLTKAEREQHFPNVRPKDAATLILIDRSSTPFKVLMGRRHSGHTFLPGKFVFPGGRVEVADRRVPVGGALAAADEIGPEDECCQDETAGCDDPIAPSKAHSSRLCRIENRAGQVASAAGHHADNVTKRRH